MYFIRYYRTFLSRVTRSLSSYHWIFDVVVAWCLIFSTLFQLYQGGQCTYPCFPGLTSTPHNIPSKPLAAFPHNHRRNKGQRWERDESCRNDYHQSSERILAEPGIEPATFCSQVGHATDCAMGLGTEYLSVLIDSLYQSQVSFERVRKTFRLTLILSQTTNFRLF